MDNRPILITRTDRVGDVVLSLPVIKTLAKTFPASPIYFLTSSYSAPVVENYPGLSGVLIYDSDDEVNSELREKQLIEQIKDLKIGVSVSLLHDKKVASILKKAGIKKRVGPINKLSGFFYYNKFEAQHRSKADYHELEYNLKLLRFLNVPEKNFETKLELDPSSTAHSIAEEKLKELGCDTYKPYMVVHATCGGSARNWRYAYYAELATRLHRKTGLNIILTGVKKDEQILASLAQHIRGEVYNTAGLFNLKELISVISGSRIFIGPSTGPMHIAVATGVPVLAIFSPIKAQSARRWGPYTHYTKEAVVLAPKLDCPAKFECLGKKCDYYDCMDLVTIDEMFEKALSLYEDKKVNQRGLFNETW